MRGRIQGHPEIFCRINHVTLIKKPTLQLAFFLFFPWKLKKKIKARSAGLSLLPKIHPVFESFGGQPKTHPFLKAQIFMNIPLYLYIRISLMRDLIFSGGVAHLSWALHACFRHLSSNISSVLARMVKSQSDLKSLQLSSLYTSCLSAMILTLLPLSSKNLIIGRQNRKLHDAYCTPLLRNPEAQSFFGKVFPGEYMSLFSPFWQAHFTRVVRPPNCI